LIAVKKTDATSKAEYVFSVQLFSGLHC